ncbi:MAG TPA: endonuclease domain-containing protein [Stellaceae bacterium]|nr:endonuclease domain-containing protein [Stellaceae bacterium]
MPLRERTINARRLRREATQVEWRLWNALRQNRLPWRFRRQHPIGQRIADFACVARKLVVELDGSQHADSRSDELRTRELARYGYRVVRFWNTDVMENLEGVVEAIRKELEKG